MAGLALSDRYGVPMNVLVLLSDEHARSVLGCAGHPLAQTPHLDALAAAGVRFTNGYTPSPICIPARASLATGLHVFEHGCWSSAQAYRSTPESWMHRLSAAGVVAESIGKLHFRSGDDDHGFRAEHLPMYLANDGYGWPQSLLRNPLPEFPEAAELAARLGPAESEYTNYDRRITERAVQWLNQAPSDVPWVLFVSLVSPHYPLTAPPEFHELYQHSPMPPRLPAVPGHPVLDEMRKFWDYDDYFTDDRHRDEAVRNYFGLVSFLDDNVGRILAALNRSGQREDTTIVYTSDHGDMLGDRGFWTKSAMYEGSAGVPMIIAGPGIPAGPVNPTPVSLVDVGPTVERQVGVDVGSPDREGRPWAGQPLTRFLPDPDPSRPVLSEYHDGGCPTGMYMVRSGRWKYVHYADGSPSQLFDVNADPAEQSDRSSADGKVRSEMEALLRSILDPELVDQRAQVDRDALVAELGGRNAVESWAGFNHTPMG